MMVVLPVPSNVYRTIINDEVVYITNEQAKSPVQTRYHIFMITGNPGCIAYYHEFLSLLWNDLEACRKDVDISVYGVSMSGFVQGSQGTVLGLQGQIEYLESCLNRYIERRVIADSTAEHKVIVVGHSVGAYIALELIRRHQAQSKEGSARGFQITSCIGLWPTITYIAQSKRGQKVGWLLRLPLFAFVVSLLAKVLVFIVGRSLIITILKLANFPEQSAEVTTKFLASRIGVYQALYMAGDEMREITSDQWDEDIWGDESPSPEIQRPKLMLWFGTDDHWVADHRRDELIKSRGAHDKSQWRPNIVIDDTGIPHSFCINHSSAVARRTADWVNGMIHSDA